MSKFFQPTRATGVRCAVEFEARAEAFHCVITDGVIDMLGFGTLDQADLRLRSTPDSIMGLVAGYTTVAGLLEENRLVINEGHQSLAEQFFALFT